VNRVLLVVAYVLLGPFFASLFLMGAYAISQGMPFPTSGQITTIAGSLPRLAKTYLAMSFLFYVPGLLPALATGLWTGSRLRKTGRCPWWLSAAFGALTSAGFIGLPLLLLAADYAKGTGFGAVTVGVMMVAFQAVTGFLGTIPVWFVTAPIRRRIAADPSEFRREPAA
jgi:hypothetical protein